ncbi:SBBP repeat-containing protein [Clostridium estertheticum]|uniref:SBBP repeat-containing protein n=1 Tax=Clostridium estertheticum TaxID=238834 RepID=UPI0013EEAA08|nr:SBBP repeat-containing protein [Clostridium estertheticum]MBZ9606995.1 SBBP repeat-containing protein [Clostridium estertheticum]
MNIVEVLNQPSPVDVTGELFSDTKYSTLLGMPKNCEVKGLVKDKSGNAFILVNEGSDLNNVMLIKKLNNTGEKLLGEFALPKGNIGTGLAIDKNGDVYACGWTGNIDNSFPVTPGAAQEEKGSLGATGIIIKLKGESFFETKAEIIYATYLGAQAVMTMDMINAIAVDNDGNAWVTGSTMGIMAKNFPTTKESAYQCEISGIQNAFITKFNSSGSKFLYSTLLGGKQSDSGNAIAIDKNNNVYVTGIADQLSENESPEGQGHFKVTTGSYQEKFGGGNGDAFVIKLNNLGNVKYCSYLGSNGSDSGMSIDCDNDGNAYVAGITTGNFEITKDAYQKIYYAGDQTTFIAKVNTDGTNLDYSSYFGGCNNNSVKAMKVDNGGTVFMVGSTNSSDFKTTEGAYKTTYLGGEIDGFLSRLNVVDNKLAYSTFIGGSKKDSLDALALGDLPTVYIAGPTNSGDFATTTNAYCEKYASKSNDGFAMKFDAKNSTVIKVDIPDENLKKAINQILKRDETHNITDSDMRNLPKELTLASKGIKNIKGLEYAINVTKLAINNNEIQTLSSIGTLHNLEYLYASNNNIHSITPLASLNKLKTLYMGNNKIEYINALLFLDKLVVLSLEKNEIEKIASLANLEQLEYLNLADNQIENLMPIIKLKYLVNVDFSNQKTKQNKIIKTTAEDAILYLDFLWDIDGTIPSIVNISYKGVLSDDRIVWHGITTNNDVSFTYKGKGTFNGTVTVPLRNR